MFQNKIIICLFLLLAACSGTQSPPVETPPEFIEKYTLEDADKAWQAKKYEEARMYYVELIKLPTLSVEERKEMLYRYAASSYYVKKYLEAELALGALLNLDSAVRDTWEWNFLYLSVLNETEQYDALKSYLAQVYYMNTVPKDVYSQIYLLLSSFMLERDDIGETLVVFSDIYAQLQNKELRLQYEELLKNHLEESSDREVAKFASFIRPELQHKFPYNIILFERTSRAAIKDERLWAKIWPILQDTVSSSQLEDMVWMDNILVDLEDKYGIPQQGIALVLPLSGRYGKFGWEIVRGVNIAQWELQEKGESLSVKIINSESGNWLAEVEALPKHFIIIGGPLEADKLEQLASKDIAKRHPIFSFTASVGEREEGDGVWRFFPSPYDQVSNVLEYAKNEVGIKRVAVLYPEERFGREMASLFEEVAEEKELELVASASYKSNKTTSWGKVVEKLLSTGQEEKLEEEQNLLAAEEELLKDIDEEQEVVVPFDAVFIADGWKQAESLIPNFFFYDGGEVLFMGPELWARSMKKGTSFDKTYYGNVIAPSSWYDFSPNAVAMKKAFARNGQITPDFWSALGYDFIIFTSKMGRLRASWTPSSINSSLVEIETNKGMAPLSWTNDGKVKQKLYIFSPSTTKAVPASALTLKEDIEKIKQAKIDRKKRLEERTIQQEEEARLKAQKKLEKVSDFDELLEEEERDLQREMLKKL